MSEEYVDTTTQRAKCDRSLRALDILSQVFAIETQNTVAPEGGDLMDDVMEGFMLASMEDQIGRLTGQFTALKTMADSSDYFTSEESAAFSERFNQLTSAGAGVMIAIDQNIKTPQARAFLTDKARNFS